MSSTELSQVFLQTFMVELVCEGVVKPYSYRNMLEDSRSSVPISEVQVKPGVSLKEFLTFLTFKC